MTARSQDFVHDTAVEVYGSFMENCVFAGVLKDRVGPAREPSGDKADARPVRLVTISGKGGWSPDPELATRWGQHDNVSLLDHSLSVARGALMFYLIDGDRPWLSEQDRVNVTRIAHAVVCIAFLHDIDKDLGLKRGEKINVTDVDERMKRYGIDRYLQAHGIRASPPAMVNYIEQVEGTQFAGSAATDDFDRHISAACRYVELADKLDGIFTGNESGEGVDGVIAMLERWPIGQSDSGLRQWEKVEINDHIHIFLLDRFQRALSAACKSIAGRLPLIELVHDGRLLCVIPKEHAAAIKARALDHFLEELPFGLRFSVNNRLACRFVGGAASWKACRDVMLRISNWSPNLLALQRTFARNHKREIDELFGASGMTTSWSILDDSATGATAKPAIKPPGGDSGDLDMEPAQALAFLTIALNHEDANGKAAAPDANTREQELLDCLRSAGREPPMITGLVPDEDSRDRRVLLSLWVIGEIWKLAEDDPDAAQELLDAVVGPDGLVGLWIDGADGRPGLAGQVSDTSSQMVEALRERFSAYLNGSAVKAFDAGDLTKRCILSNEPVAASRLINSGSRAHGVKASAFSGRDGRNDHLASPTGDTHVSLVSLAELQLRQNAQDDFKGSRDLPPLISSPVTTGLFGGLAFDQEDTDMSMGLYELNRLDPGKGRVYSGLDCQNKRIRVARLETLPDQDEELIVRMHMALKAARRLGRPIHIFRGAPHRHPGIFYFDAMPRWLELLLGGRSLRIEQLEDAISKLELFEKLAQAQGLGIGWAKELADPRTELGALCVSWALSIDRRGSADRDRAWAVIERGTRERALALMKETGGTKMILKDSTDPLIRLAWLATRIQRRRGAQDSTNKQMLCWNTTLDFYPTARRATSRDRTALVLGLASTLEEELTRKGDAAARKHREDVPLDQACIDFATHFADEVWLQVFHGKEPTTQEQRRAGAIYRFALLETYRERGVPQAEDDSPEEAAD